MANKQTKKLTLRERLKKAWTTDNLIDASVDIFLVVFDVLASPILILVRIFRYVFNKFIVDYIKNGIKYIVHKFDKKK